MEAEIITAFFYILLVALTGGLVAKLLRLQPLIGYLVSGIVLGVFLKDSSFEIARLSQIGAILLLFSVGLELSLARIGKMVKVAALGGVIQIILTTIIMFVVLSLGYDAGEAAIIAFGFSLSSTAVVVKILADKGEMGTIHGELMVGWLLVQDLAVIPLFVILPQIGHGNSWLIQSMYSLFKAGVVISFVLLFGRLIVPYIFHKISRFGSRELMVISALVFAIGTALLTSYLGVSPVLGAFLAGVVISDSQENHAIFAETRPLRDLFVAMFFVTLGVSVSPNVLIASLPLIFALTLLVILVKFFVFLFTCFIFKYHGKTAIQASLGLAQVGEFAFIIFGSAVSYNLLSEKSASLAVVVALITLVLTPILFKSSVGVWRKAKQMFSRSENFSLFISGRDKRSGEAHAGYSGHVILCGYGRVGRWVGKALTNARVDFVVIDYGQAAIQEAKSIGIHAIYGDPSELDVLDEAGINSAKAIVVAIPDRVVSEELITSVQTVNSSVKIITRAHFDDEWERLKFLRVDKIIQPEFEAAVAIAKTLLISMGKSRNDINSQIKSLRQSRSLSKY